MPWDTGQRMEVKDRSEGTQYFVVCITADRKEKIFIGNRSLKSAVWNRPDIQIQWVGNFGNHSNSRQLQPFELFVLATGFQYSSGEIFACPLEKSKQTPRMMTWKRKL